MTGLLTPDGQVFASGRARFFDAADTRGPTPKIFVKILAGEIPVPLLAQVDTGAAWSVLDVELAEALGFFRQPGPDVAISARSGVFRGQLVRCSLTLVADQGASFEVDSTLFSCREWRFGNFLGYSGFLERIRFAIDPFNNDFYFGGLSNREA